MTLEDQEAQKKELHAEVLGYIMSKEHNERLKFDYFSTQLNFDPIMRLKLYTWLNQLCYEWRMKRQTLHLTYNFADRFFEKCPYVIGVDDLQLVGLVALLVASKQDERMVPGIDAFKETVDGAYTL